LRASSSSESLGVRNAGSGELGCSEVGIVGLVRVCVDGEYHALLTMVCLEAEEPEWGGVGDGE